MTKPAAAADAPTKAELLLGKAPPPIKVAKWIKGEPLTGFEKGKVYVVDFWATWCGPCKAAIPHLSKLAEEYKGKVEVIGISISERQKDNQDTSYIEGVEKFVAKMDERMNYRVAADTPDKIMHDTWFTPTGMAGIPTAYVIDQNGLTAWIGIGDPKDVERVVGQVVAGTFDPKKEAEAQKKAEAEAEARSKKDIAEAKARAKSNGTDEKYPGYREAMERGDQTAALASLNAAFKANPESEVAAYQWKIMLLLQSKNPKSVEPYARELLDRWDSNDDIVGFVSAVIVSTGEEVRFDEKLALEAAEKTAARAKPDSRWQQFARWRLGWARFHTGKIDQAIEAENQALEAVARLKDKIDFGDLKDQCEEALAVFKKAKK